MKKIYNGKIIDITAKQVELKARNIMTTKKMKLSEHNKQVIKESAL